jgi:hypothetical protein
MKDFDEARAQRNADAEIRSFKLGGETFTILTKTHVRPEALAAASRISRESSIDQDLASLDETITGFLADDENRDRYAALRARVADPITFADLYEVATWMVQEETDLPTEQPSPSTTGSGPTAPSLTDVSASPPAAQAG